MRWEWKRLFRCTALARAIASELGRAISSRRYSDTRLVGRMAPQVWIEARASTSAAARPRPRPPAPALLLGLVVTVALLSVLPPVLECMTSVHCTAHIATLRSHPVAVVAPLFLSSADGKPRVSCCAERRPSLPDAPIPGKEGRPVAAGGHHSRHRAIARHHAVAARVIRSKRGYARSTDIPWKRCAATRASPRRIRTAHARRPTPAGGRASAPLWPAATCVGRLPRRRLLGPALLSVL